MNDSTLKVEFLGNKVKVKFLVLAAKRKQYHMYSSKYVYYLEFVFLIKNSITKRWNFPVFE